MELDLVGQLDRRSNLPAAAADFPAAAIGESLELSLGRSSGEAAAVGPNEPVKGGLVGYGLQAMPVVFQGQDGNSYAFIVPCWIPCSGNCVDEAVVGRDLEVEMAGKVAGGGGFSSPGCSDDSGSTFSQSFSAKEESSGTNESINHSNSSTTDKLGVKKQIGQMKGRKKTSLSQKRRTLVFTRSCEGNKIDGYLYQCHKNGVRISCECHGRLFSPAGFVRHAGGPETEHPLKQITVVAS